MNERTAKAWSVLIAALAAAIVSVIGALALAGVLEGGGSTEVVPKAIVPDAIAVDGPDKDGKPDDPVQLSHGAREVAADLLEERSDVTVDSGAELRGTDEAGPVAVLQPPFASDEIAGCSTRFFTTNWSYRTVPQSGVIWVVLHFTAGRDIPGSRADVDGLTAFGNNPAARVSWNLNLDKDGNCDYNVPLRYKAWHAAAMNSLAIGIEVAGAGETPYLRPSGYRKLARIWVQIHKAYPQIPLRVGSVSNCGPGSPGIVTHWMGGSCSGGHTDIRPHEIAAVVATLRRYVEELSCGDRCKAKRHQRKIIARRRTHHDRTHALYQARHCRGRMHTTKLRELERDECRQIKRRGHRQHAGIRRAKKRLRSL